MEADSSACCVTVYSRSVSSARFVRSLTNPLLALSVPCEVKKVVSSYSPLNLQVEPVQSMLQVSVQTYSVSYCSLPCRLPCLYFCCMLFCAFYIIHAVPLYQ